MTGPIIQAAFEVMKQNNEAFDDDGFDDLFAPKPEPRKPPMFPKQKLQIVAAICTLIAGALCTLIAGALLFWIIGNKFVHFSPFDANKYATLRASRVQSGAHTATVPADVCRLPDGTPFKFESVAMRTNYFSGIQLSYVSTDDQLVVLIFSDGDLTIPQTVYRYPGYPCPTNKAK